LVDRRAFQRSFKPVTITQSEKRGRLHLGEENSITAAEVFVAVKTLEAGRLQVVMKSDLKCSKQWIEKEFFG